MLCWKLMKTGFTGDAIVSSSVVSDSAIPWTVVRQAPLFIEFSKQEYWSGLPFPSPTYTCTSYKIQIV